MLPPRCLERDEPPFSTSLLGHNSTARSYAQSSRSVRCAGRAKDPSLQDVTEIPPVRARGARTAGIRRRKVPNLTKGGAGAVPATSAKRQNRSPAAPPGVIETSRLQQDFGESPEVELAGDMHSSDAYSLKLLLRRKFLQRIDIKNSFTMTHPWG